MEGNGTPHDVTLTYRQCVAEYQAENYFLVILPYAVAAIIGVAFTIKGEKTWSSKCMNRPGIPYPINFMYSSRGRVRYCLGMVLLGLPIYTLLQKLSQNFNAGITGFVQLLLQMLTVLMYGVALHPTFLSITKQSALSLAIGSLLPCTMFVLIICGLASCSLASPSVRSGQIVGVLMEHTPTMLASGALTACLVYDLASAIKTKRWLTPFKNKSAERQSMEDKLTYTRKLLSRERSTSEKEPQATALPLLARLKQKFTYKNVPGFRFSNVILCSYSLCFTLLFFFSVNIYHYPLKIHAMSRQWGSQIPKNDTRTAEEVILALVANGQFSINQLMTTNLSELPHVSQYYLSTGSSCIYIGMIVATVNELASLFSMFFAYRRNVLNCYKGLYSMYVPLAQFGANRAITGSIRYLGYQVTYASWAWLLQSVMYSFIALVVWFTIIMPMAIGYDLWFLGFLASIVPIIVLMIMVFKSQELVNKHVFTAEKGKFLAIKHKRLFQLWTYYCFLLNTMIGIASCLLRLLTSFVLAFVFMGRLDYCAVPIRFRKADAGFMAYVAQVHVDVNFSHPVMHTFIHLLRQAASSRRTGDDLRVAMATKSSDDGAIQILNRQLSEVNSYQLGTTSAGENRRVRKGQLRWWVAYTMVRNEQLLKKYITRKQDDEGNFDSIDGVHDSFPPIFN